MCFSIPLFFYADDAHLIQQMFFFHFTSDTAQTGNSHLWKHAIVSCQAHTLTSHLHCFISTHYLQMMFGCLPTSLAEQADLFTTTSHQHLVGVSSQPRWLINITNVLQTCIKVNLCYICLFHLIFYAITRSQAFFSLYLFNQILSC